MGWLWSSSSSEAASKDQLDPSLRDFLKKEAPTGPKPSLPPTARKTEKTSAQPQPHSQSEALSEAPKVPPQSAFQDGRYAHLWKNYTPQHILDDRGKNEQDRLRDIVDAYNDRKADIGRIAMENCAIEYMEQFECFRHPPTWMSAGTMCNAESRKFNRCYEMQGKLLKALGFMTMEARSAEDDERIQMHADKLYQEMLAQEREGERAKKEGKTVPDTKKMLMSEEKLAEVENEVWSQMKPEARTEYEKKVASLPHEQQEIARLAVLGELRAANDMSKNAAKTLQEERVKRIERIEAGQATFGDRFKNWWGW